MFSFQDYDADGLMISEWNKKLKIYTQYVYIYLFQDVLWESIIKILKYTRKFIEKWFFAAIMKLSKESCLPNTDDVC